MDGTQASDTISKHGILLFPDAYKRPITILTDQEPFYLLPPRMAQRIIRNFEEGSWLLIDSLTGLTAAMPEKEEMILVHGQQISVGIGDPREITRICVHLSGDFTTFSISGATGPHSNIPTESYPTLESLDLAPPSRFHIKRLTEVLGLRY